MEDKIEVGSITEGTIFTGTFFDPQTKQEVDSLFRKGKSKNDVFDLKNRGVICNVDAKSIIEDYSECEQRDTKNWEIVHDLTDDELIDRGDSMSTSEIKATQFRDLEKEFKEKAKEAKANAEAEETKRHEFARTLEFKREKRNTDCPQYFCYKTESVFLINPNDGKWIMTREMVHAEKQPPLIGDGDIEKVEVSSEAIEEPSEIGQKIEFAKTDNYIKNYNNARDLIESGECETLEDIRVIMGLDEDEVNQIWTDLISADVVDDETPEESDESEVMEVAEDSSPEVVEADVIQELDDQPDMAFD